MEYRKLGKTGLEVSVLGFGGVEIGFFKEETSTVDLLLNSAIDSGLNLIDTAASYWTSEELIGSAIEGRRQSVILLSKCGPVDGFTREDWSKQGILDTITNSLRRLKTDYLDVIQLHSCERKILERGEAVEALIRAKERGYAQFMGYSGDGEDAKFALELDVFETLQTSISIADQEAFDLTLPLASEKGVGVIAKRPIANVAFRHESVPENAYHIEYWERIQKLDYPFLKGSFEQSVATALRFTLSFESIATAIVGTKKPGRWQENAGYVAQGALPANMVSEIRERWRDIAEKDWVGQV
ncbi:MAG: aldo/keto reductase [Acidobacteria bacterium]|nr:MAG: aldo/keto reductase [Acidobacteriota bacterium]REK01952.1 MAG: aldo/keto reductase [Acidobacteriota bacterium]REK14908.1 MAG: aldo/keto reductase [Acidobacteriota bacterium]REK45623.1 MAG: aldo/keto reductase [Acidobacteriota bacterium]